MHAMMAVNLLHFLVIFCCFIEARSLRVLNKTEIEQLSTTGCILLGLSDTSPSLTSLLEEIASVYKEEKTVTIAAGSRDDITWNKPGNGGKFAEVAFYKCQPLDRSCLLSVVHRPTAEPYTGPLVADQLIMFLNYHCHSYRKAGGGLESGGILRESLLAGQYRISENEESCSIVDSSLTKSEFFWSFLSVSRPVVIRDAINKWPAMKKWSMEYLREKYGLKEIHVKITQDGVFEGVEAASLWPGYSDSWIPERVRSQLSFPELVVVRPATDEMPFGDFLDLVSLGRNKSGASSYLEYSSIPSYLPALESDIETLSFVEDLLERKHLNIWLSDGDTLGKLHFDPYDNLLCQLSGEKHLTLFEPYDNRNLYEAHIPEALLGYDKKRRKVFRKNLLQSTSMVMSPVDILDPDYKRFPLFRKAKRLQCVLRPGDVLFMPAFWWHEVQSYPDPIQHRNLAINYWYAITHYRAIAAFHFLQHCIGHW
ncbi:PREDICTED: jmjC domain-containing protein 7-like [Amphimedon queenslandica]|uniref:JmjC domain-containing protein n=1 Tax=Amphimedon queenslandica TaxID=400682 RepID=A0A1X7UL04_AMPQE|nr:PREDICTED: jmjC domain-containing protein 7-like [Amphimedon queenslandica]|eukprot:XP_003387667.2 PREDICTED: jmjC domain-containing protein 7-like [Amphimedon queenslandica]